LAPAEWSRQYWGSDTAKNTGKQDFDQLVVEVEDPEGVVHLLSR
jgi:hypothetical protein